MSDAVLLQSFLNFVDDNEARGLQLCLSENRLVEEELENVLAIFSCLHSTATPTSDNLEQLTRLIAKFTLVNRPVVDCELTHCCVNLSVIVVRTNATLGNRQLSCM